MARNYGQSINRTLTGQMIFVDSRFYAGITDTRPPPTCAPSAVLRFIVFIPAISSARVARSIVVSFIARNYIFIRLWQHILLNSVLALAILYK